MLRLFGWQKILVGTHCLSLAILHSQLFRVEQILLLERLEPVKADYCLDLCCMEGTRSSLLCQITDWVPPTTGQKDGVRSSTCWVYGSPGIGKTTLAHSICARLHDRNQLAGSFFCQRDDPHLSEPRHILPTLIDMLAGVFPPFRSVVARCLRDDRNLTPGSIKPTLFRELIQKLPRHPQRTLAFVIDAFDECGDAKSRRMILNVLTDVAAHNPWLKLIITSRPEADIQRFFETSHTKYIRHNLAEDDQATSDLRVFARSRFG